MEDVQQPTPTPDDNNESLFVPVAAMVTTPPPAFVPLPEQMLAPLSPILTPAMVESAEEEVVPPFVQKLRDLEHQAKAAITSWDLKYLGQTSEESTGTTGAGTKRKASEMDSDLSGDDDESDSEDGEEEVSALDPNSQQRPKLPIYHPGFRLTEKLTMGILSNFLDFFEQAEKYGYRDEEMPYLKKKVEYSKTIPYQGAVKLAVAGDTGAGKSALLNAVLGVLNLTIESDGGGACTCVITEFRQSPSTQTEPFAAEIQFFCSEVCLKLVKDLFTQWFLVKQKQNENPDEVDDEDLSHMATARDCLNQLFADRLEFDSAEAFMGTATSAKDPKILKQLMIWTTDIYRTFIEDGETSVHFTSATPEGLTEQYHPFTRECPNASFKGKPLRFTPWPLVQIVRVTLNSPILRQEVIVADVPGVSDVNHFRVDNAARYLQRCDMTIVVGKIDRIQDNVGFRQQYMDAYRRRRSGSVILVATRSDDLNDEGGSTLVLDAPTEEVLNLIAQKITNIEMKIRALTNEMDLYRAKSGNKTSKKLKEKKKKLLSRKIALEKERKDVRIASRSRQVTRAISQNYRADTGDDANVPVFCVSNRMYMRYLRGYDYDNADSVPSMSLEETQIPALCSLLYSLPSKGRTATLSHFTKFSMQTLLSVIHMSCSTTTLTRVKHLTAIVKSARNDLDSKIDVLTTKFIDTDIKALEDELADRPVQTRFDKNAMKCLNKWENLNAATHRAIVNKKGLYIQKKKNIHMNWNADLLSSVQPIIDNAFRTLLDKSVANFKAEAAQIIKEALRDLNHVLRNDPKALACDAYKLCFSNHLKNYEIEVTRHVDNASKSLFTKFTEIHTNAYKLREDDYFPTAMDEVYEKARKVPAAGKGVTMFASRCNYLRDAIPGPTGPFSNISGWAQEDTSKVMTEVSETLRKDIDGILEQVQTQFGRMKENKENDTAQGKKFRMELHQLVAEARRIMDGLTLESLESCKQYK